jgi:hypothetical protein
MAKRRGIIGEFLLFMKQHKAYWLLPLIITVLILAAIAILLAIGGQFGISWLMYPAA